MNDYLPDDDDESCLQPTPANMKLIIDQLPFSKSSKYPKIICEYSELEKNQREKVWGNNERSYEWNWGTYLF